MKDRIKVWDGEVITKPGVYSDVPLETYHSQSICDGPSVSSSGLRRVLEENGGSPAHFYCESSLNPNRVEPAEKKAWILGRAVHHLMLGQPHFTKLFVLRPSELPDKHGILTEWQGNKTVCRSWIAQAATGGARWDERRCTWIVDPAQGPLTVITGEDVECVKGMSLALGKHPIVRGTHGHGLLNGHIERSFFWRDKKTGLWLKSRPDAVPTDSGDFSDLKTTTSVQWRDLSKAVSQYAYHQQSALVAEGARQCVGIEMTSFSFIFVEKKPPHCVRVVMLKDEHVALGAKQNRRALDLIASCLKQGRWPGPGDDDVVHVDLQQYYCDIATQNCEAAKVEEAA